MRTEPFAYWIFRPRGKRGWWGQLRVFLRNYLFSPSPSPQRGMAVCDSRLSLHTVRLRVTQREVVRPYQRGFVSSPFAALLSMIMTNYLFVLFNVFQESILGRHWASGAPSSNETLGASQSKSPPPRSPTQSLNRPTATKRQIGFISLPGAGENATDYNNYHTSRAAGTPGGLYVITCAPRRLCPMIKKNSSSSYKLAPRWHPIGLQV